MNNVQTLKAKFQAVIAKNMVGLKLADITVDRTKRMMALATPFANDDLIVPECIEMLINQVTDPSYLFKDSVIKDGVVYPEIMDESLCDEVLQGFVQQLEWLPADGSATVVAITLWCGEEMLKSA